MVEGSFAESLTLKDAFTNWLLPTGSRTEISFRKVEKLELQIIRLEGHLEFNQAWKYMCIYIFVCMYIYIYIC